MDGACFQVLHHILHEARLEAAALASLYFCLYPKATDKVGRQVLCQRGCLLFRKRVDLRILDEAVHNFFSRSDGEVLPLSGKVSRRYFSPLLLAPVRVNVGTISRGRSFPVASKVAPLPKLSQGCLDTQITSVIRHFLGKDFVSRLGPAVVRIYVAFQRVVFHS